MMVETTRRAILGAIAVAPVAVAPLGAALATTASTDRTEWDRAMRAYRRAQDKADAFDAAYWTPLFNTEHEKFGFREHGVWRTHDSPERTAWREANNAELIDDRADKLSNAANEARWEVLMLPAPDLAALHFKLDDLAHEEDGIQPYNAEYTAVLRADFQRLLPREG